MGTKPYDGSGDPEVAWLWLDIVNKIYRVMGCTNDQRVLYSGFLMEDGAKDWWDAVKRRYPDGMSWDQFQQEFTNIFFPHNHKDSKIEEFFILELKNMLVSECEKRFLELVILVPYIQVDAILKCKRFLAGLPPDREVEFTIDLIPKTEPISIPPYRMAPVELRELKA